MPGEFMDGKERQEKRGAGPRVSSQPSGLAFRGWEPKGPQRHPQPQSMSGFPSSSTHHHRRGFLLAPLVSDSSDSPQAALMAQPGAPGTFPAP